MAEVIPISFLTLKYEGKGRMGPDLDKSPLADLTEGDWILGRAPNTDICVWDAPTQRTELRPGNHKPVFLANDLGNEFLAQAVSRTQLSIKVEPDKITLVALMPNGYCGIYGSWNDRSDKNYQRIPTSHDHMNPNLIIRPEKSGTPGKVRALKVGNRDCVIPIAFYASNRNYSL